MKKIARVIALTSIIASASISAQEIAICKAQCGSDKKICRHTVEVRIGEHEKWKLNKFSNDLKNSKPGMDAYLNEQQARKNDAQRSKVLKVEKYHACDVSYVQCTNSCTNEIFKKENSPSNKQDN